MLNVSGLRLRGPGTSMYQTLHFHTQSSLAPSSARAYPPVCIHFPEASINGRRTAEPKHSPAERQHTYINLSSQGAGAIPARTYVLLEPIGSDSGNLCAFRSQEIGFPIIAYGYLMELWKGEVRPLALLPTIVSYVMYVLVFMYHFCLPAQVSIALIPVSNCSACILLQ